MADIAVADGRSVTASLARLRPRAAIAAALAGEGERRALWLPVLFGSGIALYFALTIEPPLWLGAAATAACVLLVLGLRRRAGWRAVAIAVAMLCAGFAAIQGQAWRRAGPVLQRRLGPVAATGRVVDIDALERGWRVVIAPDPLPGLAADAQPRRIRIHIPPQSDRLAPGDRVALKGMLYPIPGAILPDGYDFQRAAWFAEIGGVGYSFGGARRIARASGIAGGIAGGIGGGWREAVRRLRSTMEARITAVLPGSTGGVASALITGRRGAVAGNVIQAFRDSGLSHLLAIAGLHLGLVAAFVFFVVRGGLALIAPLALRWPIKKLAAAATLVVLTGYLIISGAAIPTQRAFVMNGVVFAAILLDRLRLSMRICAIAAMVVLLLDPGSLIGPSFQMSFSAVVALIAVYERWGARLGRVLHGGGVGRRVLGYAAGVAVTTVVATIGTDPFSIYHFHRLALYSPLANVVAVPLSALWTLPCGVIACLLMPFGLERLALVPMGWGIDATIWIAEHVSALPGDVWAMPRLPLAGLLLVAYGGLWLGLWQGSWRRCGAVAIAVGLVSMNLTRPPDIVLADLGRFVAVRAADGSYRVRGGVRIERRLLAEESGETVADWPAPGAAGGDLACTGGRCLYTARGRRVAIVTGAAGVPADCAGLDAIVAQVPAGFRCRWLIPTVDRIDSWRRGTIALWLDPGGIVVVGANDSRGDRPWVPHPISARERARLAAAKQAKR